MYEEVRRGTLPDLLESVRYDPPRGEIVLVVGGAIHDHREPVRPEALAAQAIELMDAGMERRAALAEVARSAGVPKREVFDALVRFR
jgi:16S rRNA (cytidine1402-2'-O)-methyltransferase